METELYVASIDQGDIGSANFSFIFVSIEDDFDRDLQPFPETFESSPQLPVGFEVSAFSDMDRHDHVVFELFIRFLAWKTVPGFECGFDGIG